MPIEDTMIIRVSSKLFGEWEGTLQELLDANPDFDVRLATTLAEGESIDFISSERFTLTRVQGTGVIKVSCYTIRDLTRVPWDRYPDGYSYTFEALIKGEWVEFGPACFGTFSASSKTRANIGLGLMHLDKVYAGELGKEVTEP